MVQGRLKNESKYSKLKEGTDLKESVMSYRSHDILGMLVKSIVFKLASSFYKTLHLLLKVTLPY